MSTWNPEITAVNQVRREAEEAGVLDEYLSTCAGRNYSIARLKAIIKALKETKGDI